MGIGLTGDFIGFSFNGTHSSELGITRVSNGSRYEEDLLPSSQDKTATIPGGDGTYYWETNFTQKPFNIPIAFDNLSEEQYRSLRTYFNTKELGRLIFDERPYKYYMAKVVGSPKLQTLCFDKNGERVYKGEGTIQFIAYYPYAKSVYKWLNEYSDLLYSNKSEWSGASGMKEEQGNYDVCRSTTNLYNPGDLEADFFLYFSLSNEGTKVTGIKLGNKILEFQNIDKKENTEDIEIRISSKTNLIEGIDKNGEPTGTLYNKYIKAGDFFKIPLGESELITVNGAPSKIEYQYIYY